MSGTAKLVTRFAPSPTGYLHLGHIASAAFVWGIGRANDAEILLRLEDHDRTRFRPEFEAAILEDLQWLGLQWDRPASFAGPTSFRQSDRDEDYRAEFEKLQASGKVYPCVCSRKEVKASMEKRGLDPRSQELHYDGRCRSGTVASGSDIGWRFRIPDGPQEFSEILHDVKHNRMLDPGAASQIVSQNPAEQCGDLLIRDRHDCWTYQYGVTLDDWQQGVNLVIRGMDLFASTGRQIAMAKEFGFSSQPVYAHHPLIVDPEGAKLSKRQLATAVRSRREAGESPEALLGEALAAVGVLDLPRKVAAEELPEIFADSVISDNLVTPVGGRR